MTQAERVGMFLLAVEMWAQTQAPPPTPPQKGERILGRGVRKRKGKGRARAVS